MERELTTLRKNVEQELIAGLRDKVHEIIVETFKDVAAARRSRMARKSAERLSLDTGLRVSAGGDPKDSAAHVPSLTPPEPPVGKQTATVRDETVEDVPVILPNCITVGEASPPAAQEKKKVTLIEVSPANPDLDGKENIECQDDGDMSLPLQRLRSDGGES